VKISNLLGYNYVLYILLFSIYYVSLLLETAKNWL